MSKVFVAGHKGFLGQHLQRVFNALEPSDKYDFKFESDAKLAMIDMTPEIVINAAAKVGGILANLDRPAEFFYDNLMIGVNLLEAAVDHNVKRFVQIGTVCSYPKKCAAPMKEADFWNGDPEETNAPYGMAKKALIVQSQAYHKQYGLSVLNPLLANLYGPGDHYEHQRSHVVPALIRKFSEAVRNEDNLVTLWGSGLCTREFLYVEDAAQAIKFLVDRYDSPEVINVASGQEIRIRDLAVLVAEMCGFRGSIHWDTSKPDGQPYRNFDTSRLEKLGWKTKTSLKEGLLKTIADYKSRMEKTVAA